MPTPTSEAGPERPAGIRASTGYSPELESLRGWAILLVFFFHFSGVVDGSPDARIGTQVSLPFAFVTAGHTGVTLFFVLSAFLLSRPFLVEGLGGRRVDRRAFFERRALRIMPLYAAAVALAVVVCHGRPGAVADGVGALFFLNAFTGRPPSLEPFSAVWWSLATEAQFYLVLPLLGWALRSRRGRIAGAVGLALWAVAYLTVVIGQWYPVPVSLEVRLRTPLSLLGRAPAFGAGIAAAWLVLRHGDALRQRAHASTWLRRGGADALLLAALACLGGLLQRVTTLGFFQADVQWAVWHVGESLLWAFVILLLLLAPLRSRPLLGNRPMEWLGLVSYSVYLVHYPVLDGLVAPHVERLAAEPLLRAGACALALATCLAISAVTYRWIERPFLVRKARIDR